MAKPAAPAARPPVRPAVRPEARRPTGPPTPRVPQLLMRVWDAPTRLFHWTVVGLIILSYVAVQMEWFTVHFVSGYAMLTLLLFRIVWGFIGSETSRFRQFVRSPLAGFRHLASFAGPRTPDTEIGHNAAGGWMILIILAVLLFQVATGLFAGDDTGPLGPLGYHVSKPTGIKIATYHAWSFNMILGLTGLHILAIGAYSVVKRHDLVRAMVTGRKRLPATLRQPRFANPALAVAVLAVSAGVVAALVRFG